MIFTNAIVFYKYNHCHYPQSPYYHSRDYYLITILYLFVISIFMFIILIFNIIIVTFVFMIDKIMEFV